MMMKMKMEDANKEDDANKDDANKDEDGRWKTHPDRAIKTTNKEHARATLEEQEEEESLLCRRP